MGSRSTRGRGDNPTVCECTGLNELVGNVLRKLNDCYDIILEQTVKINELQNAIEELKTSSPASSSRIQSTYAAALSKQEHVLVLNPKEDKEVKQVKKDLRMNIRPVDLQVGLNIERNTKKGGVILKCYNEEELNTVKDNITTKMGNDYEIREPKKLLPRIIIRGIDKEEIMDEDLGDLVSRIIKQNRIPTGDNFKFESVYKTKVKNDRFNLITAVDPNTFKYLMDGGKQMLHVGWSNCNIYEHFGVKRCFKCGGYNHEAKECNEKTACVICAEEHVSNVCKREANKCINCVRTNQKLNLNLDVQHTAIDRNCKCYLRIIESLRKRICYTE